MAERIPQVGDKIKSDFYPGEGDIVRTITEVKKGTLAWHGKGYSDFGSGYGIKADGGEPCPTCGRPHGRPLIGKLSPDSFIDSGWIREYIP